MGAHAAMIVLWGANLASQPNTARHLVAARRRGAHVVTIDVRRTEAAAQSDEMLLIRPGTDAALALGIMHVIVRERLYDAAFVDAPHGGLRRALEHVEAYPPEWAAAITGIAAERIVALARRYATTKPAMIVLGGSSMHKGSNGWQGARAIGCLPALTGNVGVPAAASVRVTAARATARRWRTIDRARPAPPGRYIPNQMPRITEGLADDVRVLCFSAPTCCRRSRTPGSLAEALARTDLVVSYDLFMNDTARRFADVVLPATAWLEEVGCKSTNTHLYLMPKILDAPGETRSCTWLLRELARRLSLVDFFPWETDEGPIDALLDHPSTGRATVAALRAEGGMRALRISHVAHPDRVFPTPSGKIEFYSARAEALGLPALPVYAPLPGVRSLPTELPAGTHADPVSWVLRPRPRASEACPPRPGAVAVAVDGRCRGARRGGRRPDPDLQRSRGVSRARARHRSGARRHRVDARRLDRAEPADRRRGGSPGCRGRSVRVLGRAGDLRLCR